MPQSIAAANRATGGAPERVRVNIRSVANAAAARREQRNGREVMIVPSATLPDNIVMNGILYPAEEIGKSYRGLNRTPAPAGHPMIGNSFVSARDPEGINIGYIGAWNENARRENGRVFLDKVIDIEVANRTDKGKAVLGALEKGEPIHTSNALFCDLEPAQEGAGHQYVARNIKWDHDAFLLDEEGAATPDQGVGVFVNRAGEANEIRVVNSALEMADRELDWAAMSVVRAFEERDRASLADRIKSAIADMFGAERESATNGKEDPMAVSQEQFNQLSDEVKALSENVSGLGETITNAVSEAVKPLKDHVDQIKANQDAKDKAELDGLVEAIVKANIMDADTARELTLNAARKLAPMAKPGKAAALNANGFNGAADEQDEFAGYSMNANIDQATKGAAN